MAFPINLDMLDADGLSAGGDRHMMEPRSLLLFERLSRRRVPERRSRRFVSALRVKGYEVAGQELKRMPPPHPRADLLKHKRLIYWRRRAIEPWIATPKARERVSQAWLDGADLEAWLARHLGEDA